MERPSKRNLFDDTDSDDDEEYIPGHDQLDEIDQNPHQKVHIPKE